MIWQTFCLLLMCFDLLCSHQVVAAYNCGSHKNISTKYVKYVSDQMYEGMTSKMALKPSLPSSIVDEEDKQLLISERVTDFNAFSYFFKISSRGHYLLVFKFIETVHKARDERVFNIKIGDELIHKVDIYGQAGYGNVLHKWAFFDLKQDVIYLNKTYVYFNQYSKPALNAYLYTKRFLKVTLEKAKGTPKIDAVILVKGDDAQKFLNDYVSYEQSKNTIIRQYVSEKYHKIPQRKYKSMQNRLDYLVPNQGILKKFFKFYIWKIITSLLAVIFLVFHQEIYSTVNSAYNPQEKAKAEANSKEQTKTKND